MWNATPQIKFNGNVDDKSFVQGEPIRPFVLPSAGAGLSVVTYGLSPEPPQGLTFDDSSQTVNGTPIEATSSTEYTYTATASNGTSKSLVFTISISSSVSAGQESLPEHFAVIGNYPNPFRRSTHVILNLSWPASLRIEVMDITGRTLITTPEKVMTAGRSQLIEIDEGLYLLECISMVLLQIHPSVIGYKWGNLYILDDRPIGHTHSVVTLMIFSAHDFC